MIDVIMGIGTAMWVAAAVGIAAAVRHYLRWRKRRAEHERLAFDADWEHAALMDGNLDVGVYGRYPVGGRRITVADAIRDPRIVEKKLDQLRRMA